MQPCRWNYPRAERQGAKKEVCFAQRSWFFTFFIFHFFCSWFWVISSSMWLLQSKYEVFQLFQVCLQSPECWSFESRSPSSKKILYHSYLLIWKWNLNHVYSIFFQVPCKRSKRKEIPSNYHEFWNEQVQSKKHPKKNTSMFECYNLLDPMEWGVVIFGGWYPTSWLWDLMVTSWNTHTFFFGKMDFSSSAKKCRIWSEKHKEF